MIPIPWMQKLRYREMKSPQKHFTASRRRPQDPNLF